MASLLIHSLSKLTWSLKISTYSQVYTQMRIPISRTKKHQLNYDQTPKKQNKLSLRKFSQ